jgi:hypothetical protein
VGASLNNWQGRTNRLLSFVTTRPNDSIVAHVFVAAVTFVFHIACLASKKGIQSKIWKLVPWDSGLAVLARVISNVSVSMVSVKYKLKKKKLNSMV